MNLKKLLLYFNTVKHLKSKQLLFNFIRRLFNKNKFIEINDVDCNQLDLVPPIKHINKIDSTSVCFLNQRRSFEYISDWACLDEPKLWRYNLHYFDYLLDDGASGEIKDKLIESWIKISHELKEDAWEPYTLSIRIVNWVKYFIVYKNNAVPESWLKSLHQQAHVLFHSIEYHILANHYLKNGKGIFFAGSYLNCDNSEKWLKKGVEILLQEAKEQILADGGHYEKSPMYHSIVVEDYLDVINLIQSNALNVSRQEFSFLKNKTTKSLSFLNTILMPNGDIPLFNDSAFNIAPHPDSIFKYAKEVLAYEKAENTSGESMTALDNSGYYIIKDENNMCVIDCGSISPDYQPGHTHCDILSYELAIDGCLVIVNSGLHDYENSVERRYCRSTKAHNTVEIDGREQSEMWGQFRVARRATILSASLTKKQDGRCVFKGSYSPYWSGKKDIVHSRKVKYSNKQWAISDAVSGKGVHSVNNFIHLHPDVNCVEENGEYFLIKGVNKLARITFSDAVNINLEVGWYYPEFGVKRRNMVLRLSNNGLLPIIQEYTIESLLAVDINIH